MLRKVKVLCIDNKKTLTYQNKKQRFGVYCESLWEKRQYNFNIFKRPSIFIIRIFISDCQLMYLIKMLVPFRVIYIKVRRQIQEYKQIHLPEIIFSGSKGLNFWNYIDELRQYKARKFVLFKHIQIEKSVTLEMLYIWYECYTNIMNLLIQFVVLYK